MNPEERTAEAEEARAQGVEPIDEAEAAQRMAEHAPAPILPPEELQQAVGETPRPSAPAAPPDTAADARSVRGHPTPAHGRNARLLTTPCG